MTATGTTDTGTGAVPGTGTDWYSRGGWTGIVFMVLLAASVFMTGGQPDAKNAAKVQSWDVKHTGLLGMSGVLTMLAVVVGIYFLIWLRSQLDRPSSWAGNVYMAGAVIFGMSGAVGAGLHASESQDAKHLTQASLQTLASLDQNLNYLMTCAGLALLYLGVGLLIRRSQLLPGWLGWVSFVFAVLAASFVLGFIALLGTVLFVLVVSIMLVMHPAPAER